MAITVYTTHCPKCNMLEKRLTETGIEFTEITDVDVMLSKGFTHVPQVEIDDTLVDFKTMNLLIRDYDKSEDFELFALRQLGE